MGPLLEAARRRGIRAVEDAAHALPARARVMSLHGIGHEAWKRYTAEGGWDYEIHAPGFKYDMGLRAHSRAIPVIDWLLVVLLAGGIRLSIRPLRGGWRFRRAGSPPVLIIGAGAAGVGVVRDLLENPGGGCDPEGFLDDDPGRRGLRIHGVVIAIP